MGYGTVQERVQRGLEFIARRGKALGLSTDRVSFDRLDITSGEACILAQAAERLFSRVVWELNDDDFGPYVHYVGWGIAHGFLPSSWAHPRADAKALEAEWRRVLTKESHE